MYGKAFLRQAVQLFLVKLPMSGANLFAVAATPTCLGKRVPRGIASTPRVHGTGYVRGFS